MTPKTETFNLCTFCYKSVSDACEQNKNYLNQFHDLLTRLVGESKLKTLDCSLKTSTFGYCKDCEYLVNEFRNVYHQIKCLELKLFLKLKTLVEVMKMADKVSSRTKLVKQYFEANIIVQEFSGYENDSDIKNRNETFTAFKTLRTEILINCQRAQALSMLVPRVLLRKTAKSPLVPMELSPPNFDTDPPTTITDVDEAQYTRNSCINDDSIDQLSDSDNPLDEVTSKNEINISADWDSVANKESMQTLKEESIESLEHQITNSMTDQIDTEKMTESSSSTTKENSTAKIPQPFPCPYCSKKYVQQKYLKSHIWSRHRTAKRIKSKTGKRQIAHKNSSKFRCSLCNIFCKTYQGIQTHKYSSLHQLLWRRRMKTRLIKSEQTSVLFQKSDEKAIKRSQALKKENPGILPNVILEEERKYRGSDYTDSDDTSTDSYSSSSSYDENEDYDRILGSSEKYFYCRQDECKLKTKIFKRKSLLEEHKKLHERGEYLCKFCDKIETTAIKLSLHECEMHSTIPSTTTTTIQEEMYNCARCPFETKIEASYFKHFASVHLGIYDAKLGKEYRECEICKKKLLQRKNITETHFQTHHNTDGLEDPEKQVRKCDEDGCTAYFLSTTQLRIHKDTQHLSSQINLNDQTEDFDDDDNFQLEDRKGPFKCRFCEKSFTSYHFLQKHRRKFHSRKDSKTNLDSKPEFPERIRKYKKLVCPEVKCTKSFKTQMALETHKKFHDKFTCNFCDHVVDYAPDLATHENMEHSVTLKGKLDKPKPKCSRCQKIFQNKGFYENHFLNFHLGLPITLEVCPLCKHASNMENSLLSHNKRNHDTSGMDPSKVSRCNQCPAYFRMRVQLVRHKLNVHNNDDLDIVDPLKCQDCDKVFRSEICLKNHVNQAHNKKSNDNVSTPFNCVLDKCKQKFSSKYFLERHQKLHERGEFPCQFCDTVSETIIKLITHETTLHSSNSIQEKRWRCSRCSYNSRFTGRFQNHFAEVHLKSLPPVIEEDRQMPGKFECKICNLELCYGSDLAVHEAQHNKNDRFYITCPRCSSILTRNKYVAHFLKRHLGTSKRKECPICKLQTVRLDLHYKCSHKIQDDCQIYKCEGEDEECKAYFIKSEQLIRHKRKMHVRQLKCKECGKIMKTRSGLKSHIRVLHPHSDENPKLPFACNQLNCKKRFDTVAELDCHHRWHQKSTLKTKHADLQQDERNFKCEQCDKEFPTKNRLQTHLYIVHSKRKFICPECGKSFKTKAALESHLLYHKGPSEWKFQCASCGKKFATKTKLADHMTIHTKEKSWVCNYCGNKYAHQHNWKNHMLAKHGDEVDVPSKMKIQKGNHPSRKGTKKGTYLLSGE